MSEPDTRAESNARGKTVAVTGPRKLPSEIEAERETEYLLKGDAMRRRLLDAIARKEDFSLAETLSRAGL